jgi:hypothetical protein
MRIHDYGVESYVRLLLNCNCTPAKWLYLGYLPGHRLADITSCPSLDSDPLGCDTCTWEEKRNKDLDSYAIVQPHTACKPIGTAHRWSFGESGAWGNSTFSCRCIESMPTPFVPGRDPIRAEKKRNIKKPSNLAHSTAPNSVSCIVGYPAMPYDRAMQHPTAPTCCLLQPNQKKPGWVKTNWEPYTDALEWYGTERNLLNQKKSHYAWGNPKKPRNFPTSPSSKQSYRPVVSPHHSQTHFQQSLDRYLPFPHPYPTPPILYCACWATESPLFCLLCSLWISTFCLLLFSQVDYVCIVYQTSLSKHVAILYCLPGLVKDLGEK